MRSATCTFVITLVVLAVTTGLMAARHGSYKECRRAGHSAFYCWSVPF